VDRGERERVSGVSTWSPHRPEEAGGGGAVGQGAPRRCLPRGGRNKGDFLHIAPWILRKSRRFLKLHIFGKIL
jgi:hypothetical protein